MSKSLKELQMENVVAMIPTQWNIYEWAENHQDTTIAHALKRVEKIFDFSDGIQCGFSAGKDSTVSANLACLELNLRKIRVKNGLDRHGNHRVDPLDAKWANKRVHMALTHAEVVFTMSDDYTKRFMAKYGPEGLDLVEFNFICAQMSWQSGVNFNSGVLISWDKNSKDIWVQDMPNREQLHGFDCLNDDNATFANPVPLESLSLEAQKFHREHNHCFYVTEDRLFGVKDGNPLQQVLAVANFGRGPINFLRYGMHEKDEQDEYSRWFAETTWLVSKETDGVKERLQEEWDISKDVWFLKKAGPGPDQRKRTSTALISLRAEESLDRRVILSQGEYSTGQYSNNGGVNICSPVFDFTTSDIWRLLSATDWDVNEVYEKLYEIGVAPADQRVGSLLNYAAVRSISTVKALEPELYARINGRFQNVEFMSQFSRAGYFKIGKPRDKDWDGLNHAKAGISAEKTKALSDQYEALLKELNIPYERDGDKFHSADPNLQGKPWFPFKPYMEAIKKIHS